MIRDRRVAGAAASVVLLVLAAAAFALAASAHATAKQRVVATANNGALGKRVLVTTRGLTLYSLSVERKGRFICSDKACLAFWKPLVVAKGTVPTGAAKLATVKRPDGRLQVAFRGAPLYTFYLDRKRGDAKGEGFKDVGVWHAVSVSGTGSGSATPPPADDGGYTPPGGGYGGGYGG